MYKIRKAPLLIILLVVTGLTACRKERAGDQPEPTITVNISSPAYESVFHSGDTVYINATVESPVELHGYSWEIRNKSDNSLLASIPHQHTHGKFLSAAGMWISDVTTEITAVFMLKVTVDHEGEEKITTTEFLCKP